LLGQTGTKRKARELVNRFRDPENVEAAFEETCRGGNDSWAQSRWKRRSFQRIFAQPLVLYQTSAAGLGSLAPFYQSSGAYGFRDQLQDVMALVHAAPEIAREHILRAGRAPICSEGDVQHWWHPESGAGVRTRIRDDLLWLPLRPAHTFAHTGDDAILDRIVPVPRRQAAGGRTNREPFDSVAFRPAVRLARTLPAGHRARRASGPHGSAH
jgi:cellobiose phosphorylase